MLSETTPNGRIPMFNSLEIMKQAQAMASHASARQTSIAKNIANADTPGYRPTDIIPFKDAYSASSGDMKMRQTRAGHHNASAENAFQAAAMARPIAGATSPNGNGVSIEAEMVKSAEVRHQHDMALSIYQSSLGILRTSLGRGR